MNRRKFLKLSTLAIAVAGLPLLGNTKAVAKEADPKTVEELIAVMEERFVCSVGYPGPYVFKVPPKDIDFTKPIPVDPQARYQYVTYALRTYRDAPESERRLVQSLWATFRQYPVGARLYWRHEEKITLEDYEDWNHTTWEPTGEMMKRIRARLVFPDYVTKGVSYYA